ncbi:MAG: rod shape-determining protein RodA, partial [Bacteroidia bacterium]|nr:rod shape-determining protein RodA [Bacteroidia bacterium]
MSRLDNNSVWKSLDWLVFALYILLALAGCLSIYGASYDFDNAGFFNFNQRSGMQLVWLGTSLILGVCILLIDANNFFSWSFVIYSGIIGLLLLTIVLGTDVKGSHSWLVLGPLRIQPAEFAKFAVALLLARYMSSYSFNMKSMNGYLGVAGIILLPVGLIFLQNETGSALVFFSLMLMLYREGMPGIILFAVVCMATFFVVGLKYAAVIFLGATVVGQFSVLLLVLIVVLGMVLIYRRDEQTTRFLIFLNAPFLVIGIFLNAFGWFVFNLCFLQIGLLVVSFIYLAFQTLRFHTSEYVLIGAFALFSVGFLYSTDYAFNEVLEPHQQIRIQVLLGMDDDPSGAGYNVNQSKIAIGSGGFFGKGFLNGTQTKLKYVPEK